MLLASILKLFYWLGVHYDLSLLVQACVMIVMQLLLLHVALTHRPPLQITHTPFSDAALRIGNIFENRPYQFWQWRSTRPYWHFLGYFTTVLCVLQVLVGSAPGYSDLLGYIALTIEATLPLPQILSNHRTRSCKGFRLSVLANWLIGDAFKMVFFFYKDGSDVPWAFKICGVFQACCDMYLGIQYYMFGDGEPEPRGAQKSWQPLERGEVEMDDRFANGNGNGNGKS
jgi:solute carrier family 66, member 2